MAVSELRRLEAPGSNSLPSRLILGVVGVAALLLIGCSNSSTSSAEKAPTSAPGAPTPAATPKPKPATAVVASRPSRGCQASSIAASGQTTLTLAAGGAHGTYVRHLPPSYDGRKPMPLVVDLHGYGESAAVHTA